MGDEVSRDADEVGTALATQRAARSLARLPRESERPEVEVGQMPDPNAVELLGKPLDRDFDERACRSQPASIQP